MKTVSNSVIADVHPLLAEAVASAAAGDKTRVQYVNQQTAIVWNGEVPWRDLAKMERAAYAWLPEELYPCCPHCEHDPRTESGHTRPCDDSRCPGSVPA